MNLNYLQNKLVLQYATWETMEELQDKYPYYWIGWNGFVPMVWWV